MKTSSSQFDLMVTFMEQHGDLSKPTSIARGRLTNIKNWEELTELLNCDGSGDTKTSEKWKKVWSDYKNNTKKKAARLHRAATGTGGGPATFAKLTDLEQRVLNLIGVQVATGLMAEEAGLPKIINIQPSTSRLENIVPPELVQCPQEPPGTGSPLPPKPIKVVSSPHIFIEEEVQSSRTWNEPGPSTLPSIPGFIWKRQVYPLPLGPQLLSKFHSQDLHSQGKLLLAVQGKCGLGDHPDDV